MRSVVLSHESICQPDEWKTSDTKTLAKIIALITECAKTPFVGTGKPEPLRFGLKGKWSRRITQEHRLVYEVTDTEIRVISCKFHY